MDPYSMLASGLMSAAGGGGAGGGMPGLGGGAPSGGESKTNTTISTKGPVVNVKVIGDKASSKSKSKNSAAPEPEEEDANPLGGKAFLPLLVIVAAFILVLFIAALALGR